MTNFATMTIVPATAIATTGLTEEDYLTTFNFGYRYLAANYSAHGVTMIIDSIEIVEKNEAYQFDESDLQFNEDISLNLVEEGFDTSLVELSDGNKALQANLSQYCSYNGTTDIRRNLKISLGGKYKVSEIESIVISYKVSAVTSTAANTYWQIHLNATDSYTSVTYNNRVTGIGTTVFKTMDDFSTITLTNAGAAGASLTGNTVGGALLAEDDYLENLFFCVNSTNYAAANVLTLQIDFIQINLKTV